MARKDLPVKYDDIPRAIQPAQMYGLRRYFQTLQEEVSLEDWAEIVRKAIEQAKEGSHLARKWLSDHLIGQQMLMKMQLAILDQQVPSQAELERRVAKLKMELIEAASEKAVSSRVKDVEVNEVDTTP